MRDGGTCGRRVRLRPRLLLHRHAAHKGSPLGDAQLWGSVSHSGLHDLEGARNIREGWEHRWWCIDRPEAAAAAAVVCRTLQLHRHAAVLIRTSKLLGCYPCNASAVGSLRARRSARTFRTRLALSDCRKMITRTNMQTPSSMLASLGHAAAAAAAASEDVPSCWPFGGPQTSVARLSTSSSVPARGWWDRD